MRIRNVYQQAVQWSLAKSIRIHYILQPVWRITL